MPIAAGRLTRRATFAAQPEMPRASQIAEGAGPFHGIAAIAGGGGHRVDGVIVFAQMDLLVWSEGTPR